MKAKYLKKSVYDLSGSNYPSFSRTGSIKGMKDKYYGKNALLLIQGSYIYKVPFDVYKLALNSDELQSLETYAGELR